MELIDIIITTLSLVLLLLIVVLLLSFIFYKMKSKKHYSLLPDNSEELSYEITKKMREVVKPRKSQRYKVVNENISLPFSLNQNDRTNINRRYFVYNYIPVREYPLHTRQKSKTWTD